VAGSGRFALVGATRDKGMFVPGLSVHLQIARLIIPVISSVKKYKGLSKHPRYTEQSCGICMYLSSKKDTDINKQ
jgi:hypothetical protein